MSNFKAIVRKLYFFILIITLVLPNTVALGHEEIGNHEEVDHHEELINIEVTIFYMDACAACREGDRLRGVFMEQLPEDFDRSVFTMTFHNTFQTGANARLDDVLLELGRERVDTILPFTIIGEELFFGENGVREAGLYLPVKYTRLLATLAEGQRDEDLYEEHGNEAPDVELELDLEQDQGQDEYPKVQSPGIIFESIDKLIIRYYSTAACSACEVVSAFLERLPTYLIVDDVQYPIVVEEFSILEEDKWEELFFLFDFFNVPERAQVVPVVFVGRNVLSGDEEIVSHLLNVLRKEGSRYKIILPQMGFTDRTDLSVHQIGAIMLAGFVNGLGPCSLSMMLLFLSLIAVIKDKRRFRLLGLGFIGGRIITYLVIGFLVGGMLGTMPFDTFTLLRRAMSFFLIVLCFLLAVGNFLDFYHIRKQEYGKIKVRIPQKLRILNESLMKKAVQPKFGRWLLVVVIGISAILALGEFFCAGQIYLAMILSIMQQGGTLPFLFFVLYIVMLCIPGLLLLLLVDRGKSILDLSERSLQAMPIIKLLSGLFFIVLAVVTIVLL